MSLSARALVLAVLPISQKVVSNGLLSDLQRRKPVSFLLEDDNCAVKTFVPNGLLSGSQCLAILLLFHKNVIICPAAATNFDLPPAFEAFGVPTSLLSTALPSYGGTCSSSGLISRFSIRAMTFDGNIVNLKRKPKVSRQARKARVG